MRSNLAFAATTLTLLTALAGCGSSDGAATDAAAGDAAAAPAVAADAAAPAAAPAAAAPARAPAAAGATAKPAPRLTSLPSTPVAAGDLRDAYFHWKGAVVTFAGYPVMFRDQGPWSRVSDFTAKGEKDAQVLVDCDFASPPAGDTSRNTLAVVRGKFRARSWATADKLPVLQLDECTVVEGADASAAGDPWNLDGTPIPIQALYDAATGWQGKTVQVEGRYHSSTHSSASDTQRHDLTDASGKKAVECSHEGNTPAPRTAVDQRDGVIVEGTIGEPGFDTVHLENCRFVNRS